ncbi:ankyrin repeat-containing domain protein [Hyaloscypha finlandica]|nr:ankyrin repeat-containing domain protein [Hyaloscypha finlandica]
MHELEWKAGISLQQSNPRPMFARTANFCFQHDTLQTWLSSDISTSLILRIPSLISGRPFLDSIGSHVENLRDTGTGIAKYQVPAIELQLLATFSYTPERLLSTLIHQILDNTPRHWTAVQDIFLVEDLIRAVRSDSAVSELVLWKVLESILVNLKDHSMVCILHVPNAVSPDAGVSRFLGRLSSITKSVDASFKLMMTVTSGTLNIDTDVSVSRIKDDDASLKEALKSDLMDCLNGLRFESSAITELQEHQLSVLAVPPLDPSHFVAYARHIQMRCWNTQISGVNSLLTSLGETHNNILHDTLRTVPQIDLALVSDLLSVVSLSRRPLSIFELEAVTSLPVDGKVSYPDTTNPRQVLATYLAPILYFRGHVVQFFDESMKDAFSHWHSTWCSQKTSHSSLGTLSRHAQIAHRCLAYILSAVQSHLVSDPRKDDGEATDVDVRETEEDNRENKDEKRLTASLSALDFSRWQFLQYAVQNWRFHYASALAGKGEDDLAKLATPIFSEYFQDEVFVESWLRLWYNFRFPGVVIDRRALPLASQLSPLQISKKFDLSLVQAIGISQRALSVLETLDWNLGTSLAWALPQVAVNTASAVWKQSKRDGVDEIELLVSTMERSPRTAFELLCRVDIAYVESNLSTLLSRDLAVGGSTVLEYLKEQAKKETLETKDKHQKNWPRPQPPGPDEYCSTIGFSNMIADLLNYDGGLLDPSEEYQGRFLLHLAVTSGNTGATKEVLKRCSKIIVRDQKGGTPVFLASQYGLLEILKILLQSEKSANIHLPNNEGETPLHAATLRGHLRCATSLVKSGARSMTRANDGQSSFETAVKSNQESLVLLFFNHLSSMSNNRDTKEDGDTVENSIRCNDAYAALDWNDHSGNSLLEFTIENDYSEVAKILVERGADLTVTNSMQRTFLHLAARKGQIDVVEALLSHPVGVDIKDEDGKTALYYAADEGHVQVISALLAHDASPTIRSKMNFSPVERAIMGGHDRAAKLLLSTSSRYPAETLGECLHRAAMDGLAEVMAIVLDSGAEKNYQDSNGYSALQLAACYSQQDIIRDLLIWQPNLELKSYEGKTALAYASEERTDESANILKQLLDAGADIETTDNDGKTPIFNAKSTGRDANILLLLKRGAKLDHPEVGEEFLWRFFEKISESDTLDILAAQKKNLSGETDSTAYMSYILQKACDYDVTQDIISLFLRHGADPNEPSIQNLSFGGPLQRASYFCRLPIVTGLLEQSGTNIDVNKVMGKYGTALNSSVAKMRTDAQSQCDMFDYLIKKHAKPLHLAGVFGTPIHTAVARSSVEVVEHILLSETELSLDTKDQEERLPVHIGAAWANEDVFPMIFTSQYLEVLDKQKRKPIHLASGTGSLSALTYMEEICKAEGKDVAKLLQARDIDDWTPLHWACRQYDQEVIEWLVGRGASKTEKTKGDEWTPLDVAIMHGNSQFADVLKCEEGTNRSPPVESLESSFASCDSCHCWIFGTRYHCTVCYDFDFCFKCNQHNNSEERIHYGDHEFKVK